MSRYDFPPRAGGRGATPVPVAVYENEASHGYGRGTPTARHATAARGMQDSGLIRVFDDPRDGVWSMNIGSMDDSDFRLPHHAAGHPGANRPLPIETDRYTAWDLDEGQTRLTLGRIATPGAWAALAIVLLVALAFVFVTPAFAGTGGAISRYRDLSGTVANAGNGPQPVIDASSGSQPVSPAPAEQPAQHDGTYSVIGAPSLSVGQIKAVLQRVRLARRRPWAEDVRPGRAIRH